MQGLRAFLLSPNIIADPYKGPQPWPALSSYLGLEGWKTLVGFVLGKVRDIYSLSQCSSGLNGFSPETFKEEARRMYEEVNRLLADSHRTSLRHITTEKVHTDMKRELKQRELGGWAKIGWSIVGFDETSIVQGRMVSPNPQDRTQAFIQLTVHFKSRQTYAAYDRKGRVVAGDPKEELAVDDYWVF